MKGSLPIGRIIGIPIQLHVSWFLIAGLLTFSLAVGFFPQAYPGWSAAEYWIVGSVAALLLFASVLLHELGHSVLALRERVPVKGITLFIFGGVAQIGREPPTAGAEFRIAIAGPLTSLGLAGFFGALGAVVADIPTLAAPLAYLTRVNLLLAAFNMIPGFPLDGGRVLRAAIWGISGNMTQATRWAARSGQVVAALFIAVGIGLTLMGGLWNGLWLVFIGFYLNGAAQASRQQAHLQKMLAGVKAGSVAVDQCQMVPTDLKLDRLVEDHVLRGGQQCFFVSDGESAQGLITLDGIRRVSNEQRSELTAGQVMTDVASAFKASPDDDLWTLLQRMSEDDLTEVAVVDNGSLLGLITRDGLLRQMRLRTDLAA
jgi:Zn-dependent protease/predicted transcriptional regulator